MTQSSRVVGRVELRPKFLELGSESFQHFLVAGDEDIFVVSRHCLPRPVEGSVENILSVNHSELVVHEKGGTDVLSNLNACRKEKYAWHPMFFDLPPPPRLPCGRRRGGGGFHTKTKTART